MNPILLIKLLWDFGNCLPIIFKLLGIIRQDIDAGYIANAATGMQIAHDMYSDDYKKDPGSNHAR